MSDHVTPADVLGVLGLVHDWQVDSPWVLETPYLDSLPYRSEITNRAKRHGWREKDVAYNVAYMEAVRAALGNKKEETA